MKIEVQVGKKYITQGGEVVDIMFHDGNVYGYKGSNGVRYAKDGDCNSSDVKNVIVQDYFSGYNEEPGYDEETRPSYYKTNGVELIDIIEGLNFNRGSAVKYLVRAGKKDDELLDLKKALYYVEREIKRIQK